MSQPVCRLLPFAIADGPHNMAADETLLESAIAGQASLRFYGWSEATASLGYFQSASLLASNPLLASLPFVRRPSGGATLVHHHELTYALALPPGNLWQTGQPWLGRMHQIIATTLKDLQISIRTQTKESIEQFDGTLCFLHFTPGDLMLGSAKVVGSAQRKSRGALLQHGAILLQRSKFAPRLPGIGELAESFLSEVEMQARLVEPFAKDTGWKLQAGPWSAKESERLSWLARNKYTQDSWNRKR